jgi:hypothetical protein
MYRMTETHLGTYERPAAYACVLKEGYVKISGWLPLYIKRRRVLLLNERLLQW